MAIKTVYITSDGSQFENGKEYSFEETKTETDGSITKLTIKKIGADAADYYEKKHNPYVYVKLRTGSTGAFSQPDESNFKDKYESAMYCQILDVQENSDYSTSQAIYRINKAHKAYLPRKKGTYSYSKIDGWVLQEET